MNEDVIIVWIKKALLIGFFVAFMAELMIKNWSKFF